MDKLQARDSTEKGFADGAAPGFCWEFQQNQVDQLQLKQLKSEIPVPMLPDLQICHESVMSSMTAMDVTAATKNLIRSMSDSPHDYPEAIGGQTTRSGSLIESIAFPSSQQILAIYYDDYSSGRISSLQMNGRTINFSYDGGALQQISFAGNRVRDAINLFPHEDRVSDSESHKRIAVTPQDLAAEFRHYLKD
jgi:hypothetical protein